MSKCLFASRSTPSKGSPDFRPPPSPRSRRSSNSSFFKGTRRRHSCSLPFLHLILRNRVFFGRMRQMSKCLFASRSTPSKGSPDFRSTSFRTDSKMTLSWAVPYRWPMPSPSTDGPPNGGFGCRCAFKSCWSTLPTTAAGTRGGISGGPCVSATKLLSTRLS